MDFSEDGTVIWKGETKTDVFYKVDSKGNKVDNTTLDVGAKVVQKQMTLKTKEGTAVSFLEVKNDESAREIFEHISNNITTQGKTEVGLAQVREAAGSEGINLVGTNAVHLDDKTSANMATFDNGYLIRSATHSHSENENGSSEGDIRAAAKIHGKFPDAKLYNYTQKYRYTKYDEYTSPKYPEFSIKEVVVTN